MNIKPLIKGIPLIATAIITVATGPVFAGSMSDATTHTPAWELKWSPAGFGPDMSSIMGDPSKGPHLTYIRFTAGMTTPPHTHSHDYTGIVLSGVSMHWEPGKPETKIRLSAGAHWSVPANVTHVSECLPGAECVMALFQNSSMDFLPKE